MNENDLLQELYRFLKNNNAFPLWVLNARKFQSSTFNMNTFMTKIKNKREWSNILYSAPFEWIDSNSPSRTPTVEELYEGCYPTNSYSYWKELSTEWTKFYRQKFGNNKNN